MKSLSFKLEFFLLKGKKKDHDDGDDGENIKMSEKLIHAKEKDTPTVVSSQQKTSLRQCASKN